MFRDELLEQWHGRLNRLIRLAKPLVNALDRADALKSRNVGRAI